MAIDLMALICKLAPEFVEIPELPEVTDDDDLTTLDYRRIAVTLGQPLEFVKTMTPTQISGRWSGHFLREWSLGLMSQVQVEEDMAARKPGQRGRAA